MRIFTFSTFKIQLNPGAKKTILNLKGAMRGAAGAVSQFIG
jgi:hypothetical protein